MPTIKKPNQYFDATLYTGNGYPTSGTQSITNAASFKPDLVWIKIRSGAGSHTLTDSVRGVNSQLFSNQTAAQETNTDHVTAFNSNGFSLGTGSSGTYPSTNSNGGTYVGWQWQAGSGTTTVNTSGSISSNVSVNTTAGFSVVTYTGTGANGTVGHGLGVAPKLVILKARSAAYGWNVWHTTLSGTQYLNLFNSNAVGTAADAWNSTTPTSTVFSLGTNGGLNENGTTFVVYCWAEVEGYSKFGSYTGNGSANGPFVYTGFRPKFIMCKRTDAASDWFMMDTSRNTYNTANALLGANQSYAESTYASTNYVDFLSNGFKIRQDNSSGYQNASGGTYIYAAFAESSFKYSNAK